MKARTPPRRLDPIAVARMLAFVAKYRATHGRGPTWREAGLVLGLAPGSPELVHAMRALRREHYVTFTTEPGSLAVADGAAGWALETLQGARA